MLILFFLLSLTFLGAGEIFHPVSTLNPEAQKKFNEGLTYIFAFNHDLAFQKFQEASELDPNLAMAYWGMALALGQNINQDVTPENEKRAYGYSRKALNLKSTEVEKAYIKALSTRYTNDPHADLVALRFRYREAMKRVKDAYPEDLDAATLYAESILDLDPWKYWTWDGKPKEGTLEAIDVLQSVLLKDPDHIGANHFYIHAWEESPWPQNALMSAFRLTEIFKEGGHLLHMPCHIFILCGYYEKAIKTSKNAIQADRKYIQSHGMGGEYPLHYLTHNLKILARVYMLAGDYENAIKTAQELIEFVTPHYHNMIHLSNAFIIPYEINLYFKRWKDVLNLSLPPLENALAQSYAHFARALAYLHLKDRDGFQREKALMQHFKQKIPPEEELANNPATEVIGLAELVLEANLAKAENQLPLYLEKLKSAIDKQDKMDYDEPPPWFMPIRMELGEALIEQKQYKEAEAVFKKGLTELQRNGRLLEGLYLSLKGQGRFWDASWVEREIPKKYLLQ